MTYDYQIIYLTGDPKAGTEKLNEAGAQGFLLVGVIAGWAYLVRELKETAAKKVTVKAEGQVKPKTTRKRKTTKAT